MIEPELNTWFSLRCSSIRELLRIREYDKADAHLTYLLNIWPNHPSLLQLRATIASLTDDCITAHHAWEDIHEQDPSSYPAIGMLGQSLCRLGYYHSASSILQPFSVRIGSIHSDAQIYLTFSMIMSGKVRDAESFLFEMFEQCERKRDVSRLKASLHALSGLIACADNEWKEARCQADMAAVMNHSAPFVAFLNGRVAHTEGNDDDAIRWLERALEEDNHLMQARQDLIQIYEEAGDTDSAQVLRGGLRGFLHAESTTQETLMRIRELTLARRSGEAAEFAMRLLSADIDDKGRICVCEALLGAGYKEESLKLAGYITTDPYRMNVLYMQIMAAIPSGDIALVMRDLVRVILRDRCESLYNLRKYADLAGFTIPEGDEGQDSPIRKSQDHRDETGTPLSSRDLKPQTAPARLLPLILAVLVVGMRKSPGA